MKQITIMIKPASSLCNMRCRYCFYEDVSHCRATSSYGMMHLETADRLLENVFRDIRPGDALTFAFQGGEPTLVGLDFFRHFVQEADKYGGGDVSYALQTNGLLLDEAWCHFLAEHRFLVGLSLDGPAPYHDRDRVDAQQAGTFHRVLAAKERMERHGVAYNVLMTLTNSLARHPQQVWRFIEDQDLRFVQLTPCLGPLDHQASPYALRPQRYASFYSTLFDLWYPRYRSGTYRSIKLFDDLINLLARGQCNACGLLGRCQAQLVVEADGGVYPCDFYVLDQWRVGDLSRQPLGAVWTAAQNSGFLTREREPLPLCASCPYRNICGGGCLRMRREVFYAPGDTVCGHRSFLDHCVERMLQIASAIRS